MPTIPVNHQAGIPRDWEVGGATYRVSGVTFHQLATLNSILRDATPHPVDEAKALLDRLGDLCEPDERRRIVQEAVAKVELGQWPPTFDSPAGDRYFFGTPEGIAAYLHTILSKHQPDLTVDEVRRGVAPRVTLADQERLSVLIELISEEDLARRKARAAGLADEAKPDATAPVATEPLLHTELDGDPKAPATPPMTS